jgi:Uma2 family endonuclease
MSVSRSKVRYNYRDYCLLPEDKRYELMDGELYMAPAPGTRHQILLRNLELLLWSYVRDNRLGQVFFAPYDVILSDEDVVQPDLLFVAREREEIITERGCEGPPDLVVEILSPSTRDRDQQLKRKLYANYGVREYWLVDPDAGSIEILELGTDPTVPLGTFTGGASIVSRLIPGLSISGDQVMSE